MRAINKKAVVIVAMLAIMLSVIMPSNVYAASKPVPAKVTITKQSYNKSKKAVTLKWKKAKNASKYMIYVKKSGAKKWRKLTTVSCKKKSYTYKSSSKYKLKAGNTYYFKMRAYNKKSRKYGKYSNVIKMKTNKETTKKEKIDPAVCDHFKFGDSEWAMSKYEEWWAPFLNDLGTPTSTIVTIELAKYQESLYDDMISRNFNFYLYTDTNILAHHSWGGPFNKCIPTEFKCIECGMTVKARYFLNGKEYTDTSLLFSDMQKSIDITVLGKHYTNLDELKVDLKDKKDIEWQGIVYANADCLLSQMGRFQKFTFGARTYTSYYDFFVKDRYYVGADVQGIKNMVNNDQYGMPAYDYTPVNMECGGKNIGDVFVSVDFGN